MKFLKFLPFLFLFTAACPKPPAEPEKICNDGEDNDDDGLIDCADPDCSSYPDCRVPTSETSCTNGVDDDQDGAIDCDDSDCDDDSACKEAPPEIIEVIVSNFNRVQFEYDSTSLTGSSDSALKDNAKILQENGSVKVEIQGHADERGTTEYNLALGEKRAQAIKERLTRMGVSSTQVKIVSYGEERPLDRSGSETAWSKNRRAEFRVTSGDPDQFKGSTQ